MEFSIKSVNLEKDHSDCLVVGVFEGGVLSDDAKLVDAASHGLITQMVERGDMDGKIATSIVLHSVPALVSPRVLLVGLGLAEALDAKKFAQVARACAKALSGLPVKEAVTTLAALPVNGLNKRRQAALLAEVMLDANYQFDAPKQKKDEKKDKAKKTLKKVIVHIAQADVALAKQGLAEGEALAKGVRLAKDLGNLPPNVCTPSYLAEQAQKMGKQHDFKVKALDADDIKKLGMGSFMGVTQGSEEPPKFIVMEYNKGKKNQKPVVLVGKGITFDTGGISLKPGAEMDEMKYDMCGAASVLGTFKAVAEMHLAINLVGIIPACENMPDGRATRPGDVLTSMSGLTIEVLNTDAEGRLILCDALTYAERYAPDVVIDIATLTGACVIALGHHATGLFSNQDALAQALLEAGEQALDRAWRMPLWEDYQSQLDSNFADMANIGGRAAGSITAACFLSRFTKKYDWAHLDIAGTAWKSGKEKGGTGRPVPLLTSFLMQKIADLSESKTV